MALLCTLKYQKTNFANRNTWWWSGTIKNNATFIFTCSLGTFQHILFTVVLRLSSVRFRQKTNWTGFKGIYGLGSPFLSWKMTIKLNFYSPLNLCHLGNQDYKMKVCGSEVLACHFHTLLYFHHIIWSEMSYSFCITCILAHSK